MDEHSEESYVASDDTDEEFYSQVYQNIVYTIHKCPVLRGLFLNWCKLSPKEKTFLNYLSNYILDRDQIDLYPPIIGGLEYWSDVQDNQGACGFNANPLNFKFDTAIEEQIFETIVVIDEVVMNLLLRPMLCKDIQKVHTKKDDIAGQGDG
ncbi:uncharacterized protein LOC130899553 [Diorhabda carinulata]|uniref:uncharacterized protein LOC130899553 n=1 Tax=Diorhabda carinulata TaxID=1163345 RepID=UPI0025A05F5B|nr:uncharacterized protein LOC130899553 [Diorhabda carinulata]